MLVTNGLDNPALPIERSVLTVGNFDGVHLAHQRLVAEAKRLSEPQRLPVVALTFDPHPLTIVAPARAPQKLCTLEDKVEWLGEAGTDIVVVAVSEPSLLGMEPEAFVTNILIEKFHPVHIVEGPSFGFGRGRRGTPQTLQQMAMNLGFSVRVVEPVTIDAAGEKLLVSSSLIRRLLLGGDVSLAAKCLGRPYQITGCVVRGHGRGRKLGFPTANLSKIPQLVPSDGVYSGRATYYGGPYHSNNAFYACAISVGSTPTFGEGIRQVEAYLLDFAGDLYDQEIRLEFDKLLRPQQRFESVVALTEQLARDVAQVREGAARFESVVPRVYRANASA